MDYQLNKDGHLDLTTCFMKHGYDMFKVEQIARNYYFAELVELTAWDGMRVHGMNDERKFLHLVCKHGHDGGQLNQLLDLDLRRIELLPVLKAVVEGKVRADVYKQSTRTGVDKVEIVVGDKDKNYIVVLGCFEGYYVIRSAYPGGDHYPTKVKERATLIHSIIP